MPSFAVADSVAFVTGTNKKISIGRAIVQALLEGGAKKVYATARKASQLDDLVAENKGKVVAVELDLTDLDAIKSLPTKYSDVTLIVNNAGIASMQSSLGDVKNAQVEINVNYVAPMAIVAAFAPSLKEKSVSGDARATAIVNINSIVSIINFPGVATYSASKAAAHSLTQAQRRDLPEILVIGVYPGTIDTDKIREMAIDMPSENTTPQMVAKEIVKALKHGTEDVFPDTMSINLFEEWKADFKAVEKKMAEPQDAPDVVEQ